ncbi:MAG: restriction endonuclease subunit S [Halieaceae bacterium]|uniref:restriction endonuclease subunit S n=1 Tax=Haliea alexandrii TaxID=2448162 RepID=UPI000F0B9541|nr:restriction endonuclease subunit S [Haliea alexandrii]MCR9184728.1 restriction endonuclease subunit S [Halieaceae bacterium]
MMDLPSGWAITRLSEICEINPRIDKTTMEPDTVVSFVAMPAVEAESGRIDVSETRTFFQVKQGYTPFKKGDVLFAKITPCMENGKMAIVPEMVSEHGFGSTEFHVLRPGKGIEAKLIYHAVSNQGFRYHAEHNMTGAVGQKRVSASVLEEHELGLPPTNEQHRILEKIEAMFDEIDKGVESLQTARTTLGLYRQSLLKSAFEGHLTADWRAKHADKLEAPETLLARIQHERDTRYKAALDAWQTALAEWRADVENGKRPQKPKRPATFPDQLQNLRIELPDLPHGWTWAHLGLCSSGPEYGTAAKSADTGTMPVIRMGNLQRGRIDWDNLAFTSDPEEIEQYSLKSGDVLFNRTNSPELVGKTSIYKGERPALFAGYLVRVNQIEEIASGPYLTYFLNSPIAGEHGRTVKTDGVNQSNINASKLQEYPLPYCSPAEQTEIVRILDARLEAADALENEIGAALTRASALRQSILKKAFAGQLVPQDPGDEPAAVLLARIKAERDSAPKSARKRRAPA